MTAQSGFSQHAGPRVMKTAIDLAIVVGFCPLGQHMPGNWAFNFLSSGEV